MSHFFTVLILPRDTKPGHVEDVITKLMAQYDENLRVPEYERDCYCVGYAARQRASALAEAEVGKFASPVASGHHLFDFTREEHRQHEDAFAIWKRRYDDVVARLLATDPDATKADPDCEECHGTGKEKTTYNPLSKWDWYVVGGRWDGAIQNNQRTSADGGFNFGSEHHTLALNTRRAGELISEDARAPFAIVTPDGSWHEKGKMGWFATVRDGQTSDEWASEARGIFYQYHDHIAVGLDCHI